MAEEKVHWFRKRSYGYGWRPITWQGWLVTLLTLISILLSGWFVSEFPTTTVAYFSIIQILITVTLLIYVCVASGPIPSWQWGTPVAQKVISARPSVVAKPNKKRK